MNEEGRDIDSRLIEKVLKEFDFEQVHKVMLYLDWQWHTVGVPSVYELIQTARRLLKGTIERSTREGEPITVGTGGFVATYYIDRPSLELLFVLTSWEHDEEEAA